MYQDVDDLHPEGWGRKNVPYADSIGVPDYLRRHYGWAYVHPRAVRLFDRAWLVNLILLGNLSRIRDCVLEEFSGRPFGRVLQIACAYGDLTARLAQRAQRHGGALDIADVLPIQLKNLKWKMPARLPARMLLMDSTDLKLADRSYDAVLLFFLLHEQPADDRRRTIGEAIRVLKPGGRLVIVDYAKPRWWHPLRYLWWPLLKLLEPFALDLWRDDVVRLLPPGADIRREAMFGGFYQKIVATLRPSNPM